MRTPMIAAALLLLAAPAFAATTPATGSSTSETTTGSSTTGTKTETGMSGADSHHIAAQIRSDLSQAGFTDIHVMPESFLVRAKNKEGMPVMMVINPDSVAAITEVPEKTSSGEGASGATGSAKMQGTNEPSHVPASGGTASVGSKQ